MSAAAPFDYAHSATDDKPVTRLNLSCDAVATKSQLIRRRPGPLQGRALEKLGHAIEYLIDSRLVLIDQPATRADTDALDILMRLSRCVFSECPEIVSVGIRLKKWMVDRVVRRTR
ncbi:MAG: hypothetical protein ABI380_08720 [Edaphobacter sp.]